MLPALSLLSNLLAQTDPEAVEAARNVGVFFASGLPFFCCGLPMCILAPVLFAFWIWMIVDIATKEPSEGNTKIVWLLIVVFTHWIGALIYFFVRRPERIRTTGR